MKSPLIYLTLLLLIIGALKA